jgi:predicted O-methyltransferase YrrM
MSQHTATGLDRVAAAIEAIRERGGESYTTGGRHGYRNRVKQDTAPCLMALTVAHRPATILELGTGYGYSTLHFALAGTGAAVVTVEFDPAVAATARETFAAAGLDYRVHCGLAADAVDSIDGSIDLVFIDHQPSMYLPDFKRVEPKLSPGAVILTDNVTDRRDENADFVAYVLGRYPGVILPTQSGLLYATVG